MPGYSIDLQVDLNKNVFGLWSPQENNKFENSCI